MAEEPVERAGTPPVPQRIGLRRDGVDPDPAVTAMREHGGTCPAVTTIGHVTTLVAGYHDARTVHADPAFTFRTLPTPPGMSDTSESLRRRGMLLALDAPDHTRLRRMLVGRFTRRAMAALRPRVVEIVERAVEDMAVAGPPADLVADVALPVPSLVICELLGVPYADRALFQDHAVRILRGPSPEERDELDGAMRAYLRALVDRVRTDPGPGMLSMLVHEFGDRSSADGGIDDDEILGLANLLLIAGHETTSNVISLGTLATLRDPEQTALLHAAVDAAERGDEVPLANAVEELLRFVSPVSAGFARRATRDVTVGSHAIPAGTMVTASLCAANRDPVLGPDLDRLDLSRAPVRHVAFGHGAHFCIGAPLARMELAIAFRALLRRLPGLALAADPAQLRFHHETLIHGVDALPVTW